MLISRWRYDPDLILTIGDVFRPGLRSCDRILVPIGQCTVALKITSCFMENQSVALWPWLNIDIWSGSGLDSDHVTEFWGWCTVDLWELEKRKQCVNVQKWQLNSKCPTSCLVKHINREKHMSLPIFVHVGTFLRRNWAIHAHFLKQYECLRGGLLLHKYSFREIEHSTLKLHKFRVSWQLVENWRHAINMVFLENYLFPYDVWGPSDNVCHGWGQWSRRNAS